MSRAPLLVTLLLALLALLLGAGQAQATIYFRSSSTAQTGSGATSVTANLPSGTVAGDVMIATLDSEGTAAPTVPTGWSSTGLFAGVSFFGYSGVYFKVATASEPSSYSWGLGTSRKAIVRIVSYVGVSGTPIETSATNGAASGTSASTTTITTTAANSMVVLAASADASASFTITTPAATTNRAATATSGTGTVVG